MKESMKKNNTILLLIVLVAGVLIGMFLPKSSEKLAMSKEKIQDFINETLVQGGQKGEVKEVVPFGNISEVSLDFSGQESKLYVDNSGKVFFNKIYDAVAAAEEKAKLAIIAKKELVLKESDHMKGPKDAQITLYEYSDFECPYCKRFYDIPNQLIKNNEGKVNLVYRHFNNLHAPLGKKEAVAAECAGELGGDEAFFAYHDALYQKTQSNGRSITEKEKGRGLDVNELPKIAANLKLDAKAFKKCLDEDRYMDKIDADIASGSSIGVNGTPNTFIVNNKTGEYELIGGAYPIESLQKIIDEFLIK